MKQIILIITLLFISSCGQEEKPPTSPEDRTIQYQKESVGSKKLTLKYLEMRGINKVTQEVFSFKISTRKLKDFSRDSAIIFNFDEHSKLFLKNHLELIDDLQLIFHFDQRSTLGSKVRLRTIIETKNKRAEKKNQIVFSLEKDEAESLWASINPIEIATNDRSGVPIKINLKLKEEMVLLTSKKPFKENTSYWFKSYRCHLTHHKIHYSFDKFGRRSGHLGKTNMAYTNEDCLEFSDRISLKNNLHSIKLSRVEPYFTSSEHKWSLIKKPAARINTVDWGRTHPEKNQINTFEITVNWIE